MINIRFDLNLSEMYVKKIKFDYFNRFMVNYNNN